MGVQRPRIDWAECATELARLIPRARLHQDVVRRADRATSRVRWGLGFSGGADSVALLLLIWAHWPSHRRSLRALHFDHRLRGPESTADAAFCRSVCRALKVECVVERWIRSRAVSDAIPSEADARTVRHAFFARHARVVWFGHQQDDIAESMLMRLARGSGGSGLAAPRPIQRVGEREHLRPLLGLKKGELAEALVSVGAVWREDRTNATDAHLRNRMRLKVIPSWMQASQRDALAGAARSRMLLEEDEIALETWLNSLSVIDRGTLRIDRLAGKPRALVRRALYRWISATGKPVAISSQAFDALLSAVEEGKSTRQSLGRDLFAVINGRGLRLVGEAKKLRKIDRSSN